MTTPGDGPDSLDPATARWSGESAQPTSEPVSLDKPVPDEPLDFDPYRFGKPDYPISPEYAPPGYTGPLLPPPDAVFPPANPGQPGPQYPAQPYPGQPGPYPNQPGPYPNQPGPYANQPGPYQGQPPYPGQQYPGQPGPPYPAPGYGNYPAPPPYNLQYPVPHTGHGKAIAALVLGIGSIVFCWLSVFDAVLIILAVVFGVIALSEAKRRPSGEGRRMAIAGLACALAGAILATVLTVVIYSRYKDCFDKGVGSQQYTQCINDHS